MTNKPARKRNSRGQLRPMYAAEKSSRLERRLNRAIRTGRARVYWLKNVVGLDE